jgi:hypothetical protein
MANTSLGTIAISMTLWLADLGAAKVEHPAPTPPAKTCNATDVQQVEGSDLEVVVCAKPLER